MTPEQTRCKVMSYPLNCGCCGPVVLECELETDHDGDHKFKLDDEYIIQWARIDNDYTRALTEWRQLPYAQRIKKPYPRKEDRHV